MNVLKWNPKIGALALIASALLLAACGTVDHRNVQGESANEAPPIDESEGIVQAQGGRVAAEFTTSETEVRADEQVVLRVVNHGEVGLAFGRPIRVERWEDSQWVETEESRDAAWTMELLLVRPGAEGVAQPWPFLPGHRPEPGWYRFSKQVQADGIQENRDPLIVRARVRVLE